MRGSVLVCAITLQMIAAVACGNPRGDDVRALEDASPEARETIAAATLEAATSIAATDEAAAPTTQADVTSMAGSGRTPAPSGTPAEPIPTATAESSIEPIATVPPPCRKLAFSPGEVLTIGDLIKRGAGEPVRKAFLGVNLVIRSIGVDAPFIVRVVGANGAMPDPDSATAVAWYDFSQWPGLGGTPGTDRGNVIIAGNYDFNGADPAVFYRLSELIAGDIVQINTADGRTLAYEVEFNKITAADAIDWSTLVASTPEESVTLLTAAQIPGSATNPGRRVVWGRALDTSCSR